MRSVSTVDAALATLDNRPVDCVICVHHPPAVDGIEILSRLRRGFPGLPILFGTEARNADRASEAVWDLADEVVSALIDRAELRNRLSKCSGGGSSRSN